MPVSPRGATARPLPAAARRLHAAFVAPPALHPGIPLTVTETSADHFTFADWAVDAGIIRDVRPGEEPAACIRRSLLARLGDAFAPVEARLGNLSVCLTPSLLQSSQPHHARDDGHPLDHAALEIHRDIDKFHSVAIGPAVKAAERRRPGSGKAILGLVVRLCEHGLGAFTCFDAADEAQRLYWGWQESSAERLAEERASDPKTYEGMTDRQMADNLGMPLEEDFEPAKPWRLDALPGNPGRYPASTRKLAAAGLAALAKAQAMLRTIPPIKDRTPRWINQRYSLDFLSHASGCPIGIQWEEADQTLRVLDDVNESDYQSGELTMGMSAAYLFPATPDPAGFERALARLRHSLHCTHLALQILDQLT